MESFVLRGNIIYAPEPKTVTLCPNAYAVCDENGKCAGVFDVLPERFAGLRLLDFGDALITPGFCDMHTHAPQYRNRGLGMDLQLLDWLDRVTYPEETRYADTAYAAEAYGAFARDLAHGSTTRAVIYATVHGESVITLMEKLERTGLKTFVGKVCMDRNCPDSVREESAASSLRATEAWLGESARFTNTKPILTPRFVPTCTEELLDGIGRLMERLNLPLQSHLDENLSEIDWVRELHPWAESYAGVYDRFGLLGPKTVMAHCIHLSEAETELLKQRGVYVAHCPVSNTNLKSGIAPISRFMDAGVANIGLGSDVSGGHSLDMSEVCREALGVSKLLWRASGESERTLTTGEVFYLATRGGGSFFGDVGAFLPGFEFDAAVFDDGGYTGPFTLSLTERFEKLMYLGTNAQVTAKFVAGRQVF